MKRSINLATRPFVNLRPFLLTTVVLVVVVLSLTIWVAVAAFRTWNQQTTTRTQVAELERQQSSLSRQHRELVTALSAPGTRQVLERKLFLDRLIERRSLSWIELFFDLQERLPARARIVSLSPTALDGGGLSLDLRVMGESASAIIEFVQALEEGKKFHSVVLRSQTEAAARAGGITAVITAVYVQGDE